MAERKSFVLDHDVVADARVPCYVFTDVSLEGALFAVQAHLQEYGGSLVSLADLVSGRASVPAAKTVDVFPKVHLGNSMGVYGFDREGKFFSRDEPLFLVTHNLCAMDDSLLSRPVTEQGGFLFSDDEVVRLLAESEILTPEQISNGVEASYERYGIVFAAREIAQLALEPYPAEFLEMTHPLYVALAGSFKSAWRYIHTFSDSLSQLCIPHPFMDKKLPQDPAAFLTSVGFDFIGCDGAPLLEGQSSYSLVVAGGKAIARSAVTLDAALANLTVTRPDVSVLQEDSPDEVKTILEAPVVSLDDLATRMEVPVLTVGKQVSGSLQSAPTVALPAIQPQESFRANNTPPDVAPMSEQDGTVTQEVPAVDSSRKASERFADGYATQVGQTLVPPFDSIPPVHPEEEMDLGSLFVEPLPSEEVPVVHRKEVIHRLVHETTVHRDASAPEDAYQPPQGVAASTAPVDTPTHHSSSPTSNGPQQVHVDLGNMASGSGSLKVDLDASEKIKVGLDGDGLDLGKGLGEGIAGGLSAGLGEVLSQMSGNSELSSGGSPRAQFFKAILTEEGQDAQDSFVLFGKARPVPAAVEVSFGREPVIMTPAEEISEIIVGSTTTYKDGLTAKVHATKTRGSLSSALRLAYAYAGEDGSVASLPELLVARILAEHTSSLWQTTITSNTVEIVGVDAAGTPSIFVYHGRGPLQPDLIDAIRAPSSRDLKYPIPLLAEHVAAILNSASGFSFLPYQDFLDAEDDLEIPYGVKLDLETVVGGDYCGKPVTEAKVEDQLLIARCGGLAIAQRYLLEHKQAYGVQQVLHRNTFSEKTNPDKPYARFLVLGQDDAAPEVGSTIIRGIRGDQNMMFGASFFAVNPEIHSAQEITLEQAVARVHAAGYPDDVTAAIVARLGDVYKQ